MEERVHEIASGVEVSYAAKASLWDIAKQRLAEFEDNCSVDGEECDPVSKRTIELGCKIIDLLKKREIKPSRIIPCHDGSVSISFYRWDRNYYIEFDNESILFCEDQKRCFYRRNEKGNVDTNFDVKELTFNELKEVLSGIKEDTFEDFSNLIKSFLDYEENWHVNHYNSKKFDGEIVWSAIDGLNFLGSKGLKPTGVFPIVKDCKEGDVAIRICFKLKNNFAADFMGSEIEFHKGKLFSFWECSKKMNKQNFERTVTEMVTGKYIGV